LLWQGKLSRYTGKTQIQRLTANSTSLIAFIPPGARSALRREAAARRLRNLNVGADDSLKTKTAQIESICAKYLRAKKKRATSGELTTIVTDYGIHLSGQVPFVSRSIDLPIVRQ
jgi:hypothetical protein